MSFDEIPENEIEGYPCDCGGSITKHDNKWLCDRCDFEKPITKTKHNQSVQRTQKAEPLT